MFKNVKDKKAQKELIKEKGEVVVVEFSSREDGGVAKVKEAFATDTVLVGGMEEAVNVFRNWKEEQ